MPEYITKERAMDCVYEAVKATDANAQDLYAIRRRIADEPGIGWVSVKDRMPEDTKDVLINIVGLVPKIGCYLATGWFEAVLGYEYESGYKVTHWMPLPPEPEVNNDDH